MVQKKQKTEESRSEGLEQLPYPAYQLDEKGRFISRNKAVNRRLFPIRLLSKLDRYLSRADQKRVRDLQVGEEVSVDLQYLGTHSAIVYRCVDGYWIAMRDLITHLLACVRQNGNEMPPFFTDIDQQIRDLHAKEEQNPEDLHILRDNYRHMLRYQTEMTLYLQCLEHHPEPDDVCEVTAPLNHLFIRAEKVLRPNGFRPDVRLAEGPVNVSGKADDIRYAVALMIACAAEHLRDRQHFSIFSNVLEGEYYFSILFEPLLEGELYRKVVSGRYEEGLSSAFGTLFFQLLLLSRLANANGWHFSVVNAGDREGFLRMTLALPVANRKPLCFNEVSDPLPLVKILLSFLIESEEEE